MRNTFDDATVCGLNSRRIIKPLCVYFTTYNKKNSPCSVYIYKKLSA